MIPKIIHYIWLGGNPLPEMVEKCMQSWKKYCPDYEIKRWDESNLDLNVCKYAKEAYDAKKYAFASDFFRFYILKEHGGIYLDVDVELLKPLDDLLENKCFVGFEKCTDGFLVNPGLIFGCEAGHKILVDMVDRYQKQSFYFKNGSINYETICTKTSNYLIKNYGLKLDNTLQDLQDIKVYPTEYFCPIDYGTKEEIYLTENTYSKHLYLASWVKKPSIWNKISECFKKCVRKVIGKKNYNKLKNKIKGTTNE